jgi:hypothetical protein
MHPAAAVRLVRARVRVRILLAPLRILGQRVGRVLASTALANVTLAACDTPAATPDTQPSPCTELAAACPHCMQAGPRETCDTAVASGSDVQCAVALDDSQVKADCPVDGGTDTADAPPLPACGAGNASADAGCSCAPPGPCAPTCDGGDCRIECLPGATCQASCGGGGCTFDCKGGSMCANGCAGGGCTFQCEENAVCADTCGDDAGGAPCIGP